MPIEISFPRGGTKPPIHKTAKVNKVQYDLFGKKKQKHKKRDLRNEMGLKEPIEVNVCPTEIVKTVVDLLSYKTIQEGMVIMGSIREIHKMTLSVLLPGRISGRVMITHISSPYTKLLQAIAVNNDPYGFCPIKELLEPGQHVATKVVKIDSDDEKCQVGLSLSPHDINSELNYQNVSVGMTLWGAISDCEEHGYVVDLGIKNCRAFLPNSNVDEGKTYYVGQVMWCVVQKYVIDGVASTATINVTTEKLTSTKIIKDISLNYLQTGNHVDLTITKVLSNGLEGKFLNDYLGYVHEGYLRGSLDKLTQYKTGQVVSARILYVAPVTKLTYLTMRELCPVVVPDLLEGAVISSTILSIARGGLYVKLNKAVKGFVSFKRLKTPLPETTDLNYIDLVRKNYKVGSQHPCRILSYDSMEQMYICTMEKDLVKESIFNYSNLKLGQIVTTEIKEIQKNGLLVQMGRLTGFILNEHLTDSILPAYDKIKSKYKVGQKLKAKVWNIKHENSSLLLTIKPTFMASDLNLISYEEAEHNKQYPGIIVQITSNGVLVIFFGNVKGWIPKKQLSFEKINHPEKAFKIGQIVKCTVIKSMVESQKLSLSLQPPKAVSKKKKLRLGQVVDGRIIDILGGALQVEVVDSHVGAIVPAHYLTECPSLADLLMHTYKVNDILSNLVCVSLGHGVPILSLRDSDITEKNLQSLTDIEKDTVLRCSVHSVTKQNMLLYCPIKNFEKLIIVPRVSVCEMTQKINNLDIKKYQRIYAQITQKNGQSIFATTELSKVWDGDLNVSKELLSNYLHDIDKIRENWIAQGKNLSKYKLGQIVTGTISKICKGNKIMVKLLADVTAKIHIEHATEGLKIGDKVEGTVLWTNYKQNYLEITLKPNYKNRINLTQDNHRNIKVGKNVMGDIMLVKREFILVALRGNGNRQLAFLPAQLHTNDLLPNTQLYTIGHELKVRILQVADGHIIGVSHQLARNFEKARKAVKRARENNDTSDHPKRRKRNSDSQACELAHKHKIDEQTSPVEEKRQKLTDHSEISDNKLLEDSESEEEIDEQTSPVEEKRQKLTDDSEISHNKLLEDSESEEEIEDDSEEDKDTSVEECSLDNQLELKTDMIKTENVTELKTEPVLSGVGNFWEAPKTKIPVVESSDEEEEDDNQEVKKKQKKKKLSPAERAELARQEEERLRKIETELADPENAPKSADQLDRLVLANPNSSHLWISYIAFHLEATEVEKARAVARKALKTIDFREEQEKLNVWIAFLNLENRYGSKESFSDVLEEAVNMNDALAVNLQALNILAESNKVVEFLELLGKVTRKHKQEPTCWTGAAEACYRCGQHEQARNLMQRAVKSLDEKLHVNVIVQFALLEARWGEAERAEAVLEKVLASYPRRVDVWCTYVDMLIKAERPHVARNVLERAVSQKLAPRKMKTLFSKFVQFEKTHGDEESVKKVRQLASDYVSEALK